MPLILGAMSLLMSSLIPSVNLSHEERSTSFETAKQMIVERITRRKHLPPATLSKQLELLEQLSEFELGRFLIERGGLNGYWTHYVVTYSEWKNVKEHSITPLESFLLNVSPTSLAMQQRFAIFKSQIQQHIQEECCFASIPCGLMGDLVDLDYSQIHNFSLYGIDLDRETLSQTKSYADNKKLISHCHFLESDAWKLDISEKFDLITSNGLSIYEQDDQKIVELYRQFHNALKPKGILVTSFLTPPPAPGVKTEWLLTAFHSEDALLQKTLFVDILAAKWQAYRTEETVKNQLQQAGFHITDILYDKAHIFPTVVAKKLGCLLKNE